MVAAEDEAVGQIVAALEAKGIRQNTLIVWSSDNGGPSPGRVTSNGPLRAGKGTLYEGGVRVCAFATWDGHIKPGSTVEAPLHIVDWYPTLARLAGASLEQKLPLDGRDAWGAIAAGAPSPHDAILLNTTPTSGAIRMGDWKLILNGSANDSEDAENPTPPAAKKSKKKKSADESVELFNLARDPYEKTNLAATQPAKVTELRARYATFAAQAVAPKVQPRDPAFQVPKIWGEKN
jgi:arylsulfatase A-like enzyme